MKPKFWLLTAKVSVNSLYLRFDRFCIHLFIYLLIQKSLIHDQTREYFDHLMHLSTIKFQSYLTHNYSSFLPLATVLMTDGFIQIFVLCILKPYYETDICTFFFVILQGRMWVKAVGGRCLSFQSICFQLNILTYYSKLHFCYKLCNIMQNFLQVI